MAGRQRLNPAERTERARAIRTGLDEAASAINAMHAQILSRVIEAKDWQVHRDVDGFSALRDWLVAKFDFHYKVASDLAAIARLSRKFAVLSETATSGAARVDQVAYATRALDKTPAMRLYAKTPYREAVVSPFDASVACATPEHLVAQYCVHASHADLARHLAEIEAALKDQDELFEGLSEQALARLEVWETENGMWAIDGLVTADTGALFAKLLTTAVAPPRAEDCEADSEVQASTDREEETGTAGEPETVLPAQANRNAEALHQMLAAYGTDPHAPTRHGHTATLHLVCDLATLQGEDTGRTPTLEGRPVSLAKARLLACEGQTIPTIFNYQTGEAIELGRTMRLPNAALRRKLELEQPGGCAWSGCSRPIHWCEAHHIQHWADGGDTVADNLILLCRFHHGRVHTPGWSVTKTGPGQAVIVHHEDHEPAPEDMTEHEGQAGCGCADWRTEADLDTDFRDDVSNIFPTGLYPTEWAETLKDDLNRAAEQAETDRAWAAAKAARAKARTRFTTETTNAAEPETAFKPACPATDPGPPPFLPRPVGRPAGEAHHMSRAARIPDVGRAPRHAHLRGNSRPTGPQSPAPGSRLPAPGSRLPAPGSRLPAPGSRRTLNRSDPRPKPHHDHPPVHCRCRPNPDPTEPPTRDRPRHTTHLTVAARLNPDPTLRNCRQPTPTHHLPRRRRLIEPSPAPARQSESDLPGRFRPRPSRLL